LLGSRYGNGDTADDDDQPRPVRGWACHDLEELVTMRETSRMVAARMHDWAPIPDDVRRGGLSQRHLNLAISLMVSYVAAASAAGVRSRGQSRLIRGVLLASGLHVFGHVDATAACGDTPAV
jgi:hypothetical protein